MESEISFVYALDTTQKKARIQCDQFKRAPHKDYGILVYVKLAFVSSDFLQFP